MKRGVVLITLFLCIPLFISFRMPATQEKIQQGDSDFDSYSRGSFCWADFDQDGLQDLYISRAYSPGSLLRNLGDGEFEDVSAWADPTMAQMANHAIWGDYDRDGHRDLYLVRDGVNLLFKNLYGREFMEIAEEAV